MAGGYRHLSGREQTGYKGEQVRDSVHAEIQDTNTPEAGHRKSHWPIVNMVGPQQAMRSESVDQRRSICILYAQVVSADGMHGQAWICILYAQLVSADGMHGHWPCCSGRR